MPTPNPGWRSRRLGHIFITHLHSDHLLEYGGVIYNAWAAGLKDLLCGLLSMLALLAFIRYLEGGRRRSWYATGIALFVLAMVALIGSLGLFLREIYLGVNTVACPIP